MATSTVRVLFTGDSAAALRSVRGLERGFGGLGSAARVAGAAISLGIVGGLGAAVKQAVAFDRSLRNVNSIAKLSETQFKALSKQVLALSKETGKGPKDLADGLYDIVSSGLKAREAVKVLAVSATAATAGMTDTATASKAVVAGLNAWKLPATQAKNVASALFETVNLGVLTFEDLSQNFGDLTAIAPALGVSIQEAVGAFAAMTKQGGPAAEHATRFKGVLSALLKPSEDLAGTLHELGFANGEAAIKSLGLTGTLNKLHLATGGSKDEIAKLFPDIRALAGFLSLTGKNAGDTAKSIDGTTAAFAKGNAHTKAFAEQSKSIAFQWAKAKASLAAAAVPLGQLLFPLLTRGAEAIGDFAQKIEQNMPEIQARFGQLAGGIRDVAGALGQVASNQAGQALLVGLLSGTAVAQGATKIQDLARGVSLLPTPVAAASVAFGLFASAVFLSISRGDRVAESFRGIVEAARDLRGALSDQRQAHLNVAKAETAAELASLNLDRAKKTLADTVRRYGKDSREAREASLLVAQASQAEKQATLDLATAKRHKSQADERAAAKARDHKQAQLEARDAVDRAFSSVTSYVSAVRNSATSTKSWQDILQSRKVRDYADRVAELWRATGAGKKSANEARDAVLALGSSLGRLPTVKEVKIFVRTFGSTSGVAVTERNRASIGRAAGGMVPMMAGATRGTDSVPILAMPGEAVLSVQQVASLGGPRALASMFGWTGDRASTSGYAFGGIVGGARGTGRVGAPARRARAVSAAGTRAFAAVEAVQLAESDLDRAYGQLARQFSITDEQLILTDSDGNERLDPAAVRKRLGEIDQLVQARRRMIRLIDDEKAKLRAAIEKLQAAVTALVQAIKAERDAAAQDAREITRLERQEFKSGKAGDTARKARDRKLEGLRASESRHRTRVGSLEGDLGSIRSDLETAVRTLGHDVGFRRRDMQLDIAELLSERAAVAATRPGQPGLDAATGVSDDDGRPLGGFSIDTSDAIISIVPDIDGATQLLLDQLRSENARLRLALGVQGVQLPVIGNFQKGTIHVPTDMVAQLHAGEQVIRPGVNTPNSTEAPEVNVYLSLAGGMEWLKDFVDVRVDAGYPRFNKRFGMEADRRMRGGIY